MFVLANCPVGVLRYRALFAFDADNPKMQHVRVVGAVHCVGISLCSVVSQSSA